MYLATCLILVLFSLTWYFIKPFYWRNKNIPYLNPFATFLQFKQGIPDYFMELRKKFPDHKYFGMHFVTRPTLCIKDPQLIQRILIKDFDYFSSHGMYVNQEREPLGANLLRLRGQQWKAIRTKLNQYFASGKGKAMLGCVDSTFPKLTGVLDKNIAQDKPCDIHTILMRATNDITAQAIFGIETDTFFKEESIFLKITKNFLTVKSTIVILINFLSAKLYDLLKLTMFEKEFNKLIRNIVVDSIDYRRKNNIYRQDFLQGMMELLDTEQTDERKYFPDNTRVPMYNLDTVVSQAVILHIGGVETTALAMTFFLYEMALNPEIQTKCRSEVNSVVDNDEPLSVNHLSKLPYLTAAIQETLRLHSPLLFTMRECTKKYKLPDSELVLEPGTLVLISIVGLHMDEKFFSKPNIFRPERFIDEEKNSIKSGVYIPFGLGPKMCIGMNFANNLLKLVLGRLIQQYEFCVCSETQVPVEYNKHLILKKPGKEMWLKLKPLKVSKQSP